MATNSYHHHGYVDERPLSQALPVADLRQDDPLESMHSARDVAEWLAGALRGALGKEGVVFSDEKQLWAQEASRGETIVTGLQNGPTIAAVAVSDSECDCGRRLKPVHPKRR